MIDELKWNVKWDKEMQKLLSCWTPKNILEVKQNAWWHYCLYFCMYDRKTCVKVIGCAKLCCCQPICDVAITQINYPNLNKQGVNPTRKI
jgi:hypothetical protein